MKLVLVCKVSDQLEAEIDRLLTLPGCEGDVINLGGEEWIAKEVSVAHDKATELAEDLHGQLQDSPIEWAILPAENRKKKLLISDMDSTVIGQECVDELADFAGKKDEVAAITERAMAGELDFEGALTTRVAMLKGTTIEELEVCMASRIALTPGARTVVRTMAENGARCVLVSGGFTFFTSRVAKLAGFHHDRANTLIMEDDRLTGEVGLPILGREAKLVALNEEAAIAGCTAEDAIAMGDGANDLAMIEAAGLGLAFRAKPVVAAKANVAITQDNLIPALFYQGYIESEFVTD